VTASTPAGSPRVPGADPTPSPLGPQSSALSPDQDYSVLTPERVSLQFDVAGIGSRAAAALIDTAIQAAIATALFILFIVLFSPTGRGGVAGGLVPGNAGVWLAVLVLIVVALGVFFLLWGYYMVFEIVWSGQTPGKRALGIRVIRENGYPLRAGDAVVRNLVRIVDGPPVGAVVGALVMLFNERAKRLGDFAAGTIVVREGRRQRLDQLPGFSGMTPAPGSLPGPPPRPAAPGVPASFGPAASTTPASTAPATSGAPAPPGAVPILSAEDATLLRDFLVRRRDLYGDARATLARRLALHLSRRYGLPEPPRGRDEPFLESLASG